MKPLIESRANSLVKHLRKLGTSRSYRREKQEFLCDGPKLLEEAYRAGADIHDILVDANALEKLLERLPWLENKKVSLSAPGILESASAVETPQGVLFSCAIPNLKPGEHGRVILLDRLQDTGNMGTIIRGADAFGIDAVIAEDSADFFNPKTVRAAMGALFRVPVFQTNIVNAIEKCREANIPVYAAMLNREAKSPDKLNLSRAAVIIGNEGSGVREEIADCADGAVFIPMPGQAESLNAAVAASILMWEMTRSE